MVREKNKTGKRNLWFVREGVRILKKVNTRSSHTLATWWKEPTHWERPDAGKDWRREEKGTTEDEMVGRYHQHNGHEFEHALGDGEGQGSLAGGSPIQFICSVVSDSLRPHESQHTRPPCPSPTPGVHSNSCPLSRWCHPAISPSAIPFSSCLQSFPASGSFPMSHFFASGGRSPLGHKEQAQLSYRTTATKRWKGTSADLKPGAGGGRAWGWAPGRQNSRGKAFQVGAGAACPKTGRGQPARAGEKHRGQWGWWGGLLKSLGRAETRQMVQGLSGQVRTRAFTLRWKPTDWQETELGHWVEAVSS